MVSTIQFSAATLAVFASTVLGRALPMPNAFALAMAQEDGATYQCHSDCGNAIIQARNCGDDTSCYCDDGTEFQSLMVPCYECGSTLWDDYGSYLAPFLANCNMATTPAAAETTAAATTSAAAETTSAAAETTSEAPATTSEAPATTSEAPAATTSAAASTSEAAASTSAAATTSAAASSSAAASTSAAATTSAAASSSVAQANTTIQTSAPVQQSNGAGKVGVVFGAAALGVAALLI